MSALTVERLVVELGGRNVVDGVSFGVEHGEWVTLIGPNGAGKTSLMRAVAGLVKHEGTIAVDGTSSRAASQSSRRCRRCRRG
jgi:ABC-type branched-subunit amino acid transport system ATPase component